MAEYVSLAAGVVQLADFAFRSSVSLYQTVKSFKSHKKRVCDLAEEAEALSEVLKSLCDTVNNSASDSRLSALNLPLQRCGRACKEFEKELERCTSRSAGDRTSFRDWAKMKYMGEDIDGFRRLLASYKQTICVALTDATLRSSSATAESLVAWTDLASVARADLEDRLESIDEKLSTLINGNLKGDEVVAADITSIREERLSTEKCLEICAQLANHIDVIQRSTFGPHGTDAPAESLSDDIVREGLEDCKKNLAQTTKRLEELERQLLRRMVDKSAVVLPSAEDHADLLRLRDEWEATRQSLGVCTTALEHMRIEASTIENYATGDAIQFMVSTNGKLIHGKNRGLGWRTRQVGGHMNDQTVREIARTLSSHHSPAAVLETKFDTTESLPSTDGTLGTKDADTTFKGQGHTLNERKPAVWQ